MPVEGENWNTTLSRDIEAGLQQEVLCHNCYPPPQLHLILHNKKAVWACYECEYMLILTDGERLARGY